MKKFDGVNDQKLTFSKDDVIDGLKLGPIEVGKEDDYPQFFYVTHMLFPYFINYNDILLPSIEACSRTIIQFLCEADLFVKPNLVTETFINMIK